MAQVNFADFLQGTVNPQTPTATDFASVLQNTVKAQKIQPASNNFSDYLKKQSSLKVSSPLPPKPPKQYTDSGLDEQLKPILEQHPFLGSKGLTSFIAGTASTFATPVYDAAQYAYGQSKVPTKVLGQQNSDLSTPSSLEPDSVRMERAIKNNLLPVYTDVNGQARTVLNDLPIDNKTPAQIAGDWTQSIMIAYAPDFADDLITAGFSKVTGAETLLRTFAQASTKGAINFGLPFGIAQAISSGTTNPKEFASIVGSSMVQAGLFTGAIGTAIPALATGIIKGIDLTQDVMYKTQAIQNKVYYDLLDKGYTGDQARALASQGGYVGGLPDPNQPPIPVPQSKQRGFVKSIIKSPTIANDVADEVNSQVGRYQVYSDAAAVQKAAQVINTDPDEAMKIATSNSPSKDSITTAIVLGQQASKQYLDSTLTGNLDTDSYKLANKVLGDASVKLTQAGQAVQSASLLTQDLSDPSRALLNAHNFLNSFNRSVIPMFDKYASDIHTRLTDLNGQIADQVIEQTPELQPKEEEAPEEEEVQPIKPTAKKPQMDVTPPDKTPRSPLMDLIYAEGLINPDKTPEQKLADKVKIQQAVRQAPRPVQDMISTLYKIAQEDLPAKGKSVPRDPVELMGQAIRDKATYRDVFAKAQQLVQLKYQDNPEAMGQLQQFFGRDLSGELPVADKQVSGALKNQMQEGAVNLGDLVKKHYTEVDSTGKGLAQKIAEKANIAPEDATALADKIQKKFNDLSSAKKESLLKQMFKERNIKKLGSSDIQKIIEMTNLGAFDKQDLRQSLAQKMGLTTLHDTEAKEIMDRANAIQMEQDPEKKSQLANQLRQKIMSLKPTSLTSKFLGTYKQALFSAAFLKKLTGETTMAAITVPQKMLATLLDTTMSAVSGGARTESFTLKVAGKMVASVPSAIASEAEIGYGGVGGGAMEHLSNIYNQVGINDFRSNIKYSNSPVLNFFGNLSSNLLGLTTGIFQNVHLPAMLENLSRVDALNDPEVKAGNVSFEDKVNQVRQDVMSGNREDIGVKAINYALEMTFQNNSELAIAGRSLKEFFKGIGKSISPTNSGDTGEVVGTGITPVYKTPANIFDQVLNKYGPGSYLKIASDVKSAISIGWTPEIQNSLVNGLSKSAIGTSLIWLGGYLAKQGLMTGSYPVTRQEKANWQAEQTTPTSVQIDGQWKNIGTAMPVVGTLMALGADLAKLPSDSSALSTAGVGLTDIGNLVSNMPMVYGLSTVMQAVNNPTEYGSQFVQNFAASLVPAIVRQTARAMDPIQRNPQGIVQEFESRIPGLTKKVPPKLDALGNEHTYPGGLLANLDPFGSTKAEPNPIIDEAKRLGVSLLPPNQTVDGIKLTSKEYAEYEKSRGVFLTGLLQNGMSLPDGKKVQPLLPSTTYKGMSDDDKTTAFKQRSSLAAQYADTVTFPQIMIRRFNLPKTTNTVILKKVLAKLSTTKKSWLSLPSDKQQTYLQTIMKNPKLIEQVLTSK